VRLRIVTALANRGQPEAIAGDATMPDDDILTVAQVAAQFSVTPQTVRSWIDNGTLKAGRVGKAYRILRGDVYAMVQRAATQRRSVDPDLWGERASELPATSAPSEPVDMWASTGTAGALIPPESR
jgi:excisionase family DNA binding protein